MRRGLQIVVALMAVFLLVRPFDCFAAPQSDKKARDCCKKGNCKPSNSDDCCKATVQDAGQLLTAKAAEQPVPVLHAVVGRDLAFAISLVSCVFTSLRTLRPPWIASWRSL